MIRIDHVRLDRAADIDSPSAAKFLAPARCQWRINFLGLLQSLRVQQDLISDRPGVAHACWIVRNQLVEHLPGYFFGESLHQLIRILKIRSVIKAEPYPLPGLRLR